MPSTRGLPSSSPLLWNAFKRSTLSRSPASGKRTNPASEALHTALGFERVGVLREVGRKFDRWVDTALWQRLVSVGRSKLADLYVVDECASDTGWGVRVLPQGRPTATLPDSE